jgi:cysteine synthase
MVADDPVAAISVIQREAPVERAPSAGRSFSGAMQSSDVATDIVDRAVRDRAVRHLRQAGVRLPTFAQLARPQELPAAALAALAATAPDEPSPANLYRLHWYNDRARTGFLPTPAHIVLPPALTGVVALVVVVLGCTFPLIAAHKVLPAYACLVPRLVTGRFDPTRQRAVWPSTGNFCRGGIAISRILGCRGLAVLPQGMSAERFQWLSRWVAQPEDVIRTPGSESNVKEIYDKCAELARDPANVILNQFAEFGNYVVHYACTGPALERVFEAVAASLPTARLAAFVAASGSAGTLAAGDYLKERHGSLTAVVEASECPTLLRNGYGEHNIQGIGDKHVPLIHNVMNNDIIVGVSDRCTDALDLLFNDEIGIAYLRERRRLDPPLVGELQALGLSGIANVVAAIKTAKRLDLSADDVLLTVATDSAALYASERAKFAAERFPGGFDRLAAGEVFGQYLAGIADNDVLELTHHDRSRIFNLGYYTWVEQQGVPLALFERRRHQDFWRQWRGMAAHWDGLIEEFNRDAGV